MTNGIDATPWRNMQLIGCLIGVLFCVPLGAYEAGEEVAADKQRQTGIVGPPDIPDREEGQGPFQQLLITNVTIIDGTGAPAYGPAHVVINKDRIVRIVLASQMSSKALVHSMEGEPEIIEGDGQFLLPGFIDTHVHFTSGLSAFFGAFEAPDYAAKLYLAHGITTVRDVGAATGLTWLLRQKQRSDAGAITAPRIVALAALTHPSITPVIAEPWKKLKQWIRSVHQKGADGVKFTKSAGETLSLQQYTHVVQEIQRLGMQIANHHPTAPGGITILQSAELGVDSSEHIFTMARALARGKPAASAPLDYVRSQPDPWGDYYSTSKWDKAHSPGSPQWQAAIDLLIRNDHTLVPTFAVIGSLNDLMRERQAEWHADYTLPFLMQAFEPNTVEFDHAFYHDWTTAYEATYTRDMYLGMQFINDFHRAGGRVSAGADAGYYYQLYGFAFVRELELLQMAGLHPLEVVKAATLNGAELVKLDEQIGSIAVGKKADLVLLAENPLMNFKVLYGTGHPRLNQETGINERVGGIHYTIKDGIVWDAKQLLADVRTLVAAAKQKP